MTPPANICSCPLCALLGRGWVSGGDLSTACSQEPPGSQQGPLRSHQFFGGNGAVLAENGAVLAENGGKWGIFAQLFSRVACPRALSWLPFMSSGSESSAAEEEWPEDSVSEDEAQTSEHDEPSKESSSAAEEEWPEDPRP